jgi:drug/metabolite transporter (DMT)-like permease
MMKANNPLERYSSRVPGSLYLAIAVLIFSASNSITRKVVEIGQHHTIDGRNPISLCNVLFVGNICALGLMAIIFYKDWRIDTLRAISRKDWISLTVTGILSGAIAPALIFSALGQANVTNVVIIGRIEPILTLIFSVWLLGLRIDRWTVISSLVSFTGVIVTVLLGSSGQMIQMGGFQIGMGEVLVAIAALIGAISTVINKLQLQTIPLGIFSIYRNILGTVIFFFLAKFLYGSQHFIDAFSPLLWEWMIIYAAIIVVMGKLCWLAGLRKATSTELNLANLLNPIISIFMAFLILSEVPTKAQYIGGSLLLAGVILGLIGNLYPSKIHREIARVSSREAMDNFMGFRGV